MLSRIAWHGGGPQASFQKDELVWIGVDTSTLSLVKLSPSCHRHIVKSNEAGWTFYLLLRNVPARATPGSQCILTSLCMTGISPRFCLNRGFRGPIRIIRTKIHLSTSWPYADSPVPSQVMRPGTIPWPCAIVHDLIRPPVLLPMKVVHHETAITNDVLETPMHLRHAESRNDDLKVALSMITDGPRDAWIRNQSRCWKRISIVRTLVP